MPKENFYFQNQVENDGQAPDLTIAWGEHPTPATLINGHPADRSGINRLIQTLRRARDQVHGKDQ